MQVDFADLRQRIPIEQVAQALGLTLTKHGNQLRAPCPICKSPDKRGLVITPAKSAYYCFHCKAGGDCLTLASKIKGIPIRDAGIWVAEQCGASAPNNSPNTSPRERAGFDAAKYAANLKTSHPSLEPLGISPEVLEAWRAGWAGSGVLRGLLALPATRDGEIVAYFGRNADGHLAFINGFVPQDYIFGEDKVEEGTLQLVRDPLDVIKAREAGMNVVCFLTETITAQQLEMLAALIDSKKCESVEVFA
jgi:CHC2 zinc finger